MKGKFLHIGFIVLITATVLCMTACDNKGNEKQTVVDETTKNKGEYCDKFVDFIKNEYNTEPFDNITEKTYSFAKTGEDGDVINTFMYRFFDDEASAKDYYDFTISMYKEENREVYEIGDEAVHIQMNATDDKGNVVNDENKAYHLLVVKKGCNVFYADSKEGKFDYLESFVKQMIE